MAFPSLIPFAEYHPVFGFSERIKVRHLAHTSLLAGGDSNQTGNRAYLAPAPAWFLPLVALAGEALAGRVLKKPVSRMKRTPETTISRRLTMFAAAAMMLLCGMSLACNSSPQAKEAKYLRRGEALVAKKDYARAFLEFKNASNAMPNDAEPYYQAGITYLAMGDLPSGIANLRKATELNPKHELAQLKVAELLTTSNEKKVLQQAATRLEGVLSTSPDNSEANDVLALAEWKLGKTEEAVGRLQDTLKKFPSRLQTSVELARLKLKAKDFTGGEAVLRQAVANAPKSSTAELALGQLYMLLNQPAKAEPELRRAVQLDAKDGPALMALGAVQAAGNRMVEAEQTFRQAAALPSRQFKQVHALFLYQEGKHDAALAELERISRDDPDDRSARNRLVTAYVSIGKNQAALDLLSSVLKKNPKDTDALFQKGGILFRAGNLAEADKDLREVLRFKPDMAPAHMAMADVDKAQGLLMMERAELTEALRINPALLPARLKLARSFTPANEPKSALDVLNAAAPEQKNTLAVVAERNWALLAAGQIKEARSNLVQALHVQRFPELVVQDALAKLEAADYAGATADAEETIRNNPEDVRGLRLLADTYLAQKQPAKAEARLKEAVAAHPKSAPLANLLANWYLDFGNLPEARKAFEAALMADPKYGPANLALAALDSQEKHYDDAHKRLAGVVAADPSNVPALIMLAGIAGETGDHEESVRRYRAAVVLDGSNVMALNGLAYGLIASEPDEALKYARRAAELAPNNAAIADTLGWAYYRKAIYATAETYLESAVSKDPSPRREFHLALCYLKTGKRDLGAKTLQMALQKDPSLAATEKGWQQ